MSNYKPVLKTIFAHCNCNGKPYQLVEIGKVEKLEAENKRLSEVIVKDNRHINNLDKQNQILLQALELACDKLDCFAPDEKTGKIILAEDYFIQQAEKEFKAGNEK